jgi:RNA polymerase sigma-70 factor (ECF subfamily)
MTVEMLVDHLFRQSAAQMVAALTRALGPERLDLAEEVVQDALARALETWPYRGIPDNPRGWLFQVARNRALDILRRDANLAQKLACFDGDVTAYVQADHAAGVADHELAMIFMCCHPALPREAQVALTLKTVCAFSVIEIAAAFLAEPATVAQRIVRAKRLIAERELSLELPEDTELGNRLEPVLEVIYLLFTEGYSAHEGEGLVREELCNEAIRLTRLLAANERTCRPAVHALLALLLLQASRLPARRDGTGNLLLLREQDRSRWHQALIGEGMRHLECAAEGDQLTPYHVQAAIAAAHAAARDDAATDWTYILQLYDQLVALTRSPVVELNRAVALARVQGPYAGIRELERLHDDGALRRYYLLPAVMAGLWYEAGRPDQAATWYVRALELPCNASERRFMQERLSECAPALPAIVRSRS